MLAHEVFGGTGGAAGLGPESAQRRQLDQASCKARAFCVKQPVCSSLCVTKSAPLIEGTTPKQKLWQSQCSTLCVIRSGAPLSEGTIYVCVLSIDSMHSRFVSSEV
ncbi:hypothetical protein V5799_005302 [Amblyomma americanum]|uniref:Uncharacterized protein n=1 Tax=Amblyomma americanum TaxID=6943 RepID=A0AAQ4DZM6_AMBAM